MLSRIFNIMEKVVLTSKVVETNVFVWHTEVLSHFLNSLVHHRRTTEVEFNIFGGFMFAQVLFDYSIVYEA